MVAWIGCVLAERFSGDMVFGSFIPFVPLQKSARPGKCLLFFYSFNKVSQPCILFASHSHSFTSPWLLCLLTLFILSWGQHTSRHAWCQWTCGILQIRRDDSGLRPTASPPFSRFFQAGLGYVRRVRKPLQRSPYPNNLKCKRIFFQKTTIKWKIKMVGFC